MAVLIALVYVTVDQGFKTNLLRASDDDLRAIRKAYTMAVPRSRGEHEAREMIEDRTLASDAEDRFLLQRGAHGKLAGNLPAMAPRIGTFYARYPQSSVAATADPGHEVLGRGEFIAPGLYAFAGRDIYEVRRSEHRILLIFGGVLGGSIVLAALSGLWLSRRFLRRIDSISETCHAIMAGHFGDRIPTTGTRGELERLAATINGMLDRIQSLMESLRQVSNDIAHDLRTPLAHLRYSLEKAHADGHSPQHYAAAVEQALREADRLLDMFGALLRIARIEAGGRREGFQNIDIGQILSRTFEMYKPLMDDTAHSFEIVIAERATVPGDPQMLLQLLTNLLDNAINHTPSGTGVTGWAGIEGGLPTLVIADTGPGIPQADRTRVFRRFFRLEQSRTSPGSGLGLSLVAAIAETHGAQIELGDNAPGLRVTIRFPAPTTAEGAAAPGSPAPRMTPSDLGKA